MTRRSLLTRAAQLLSIPFLFSSKLLAASAPKTVRYYYVSQTGDDPLRFSKYANPIWFRLCPKPMAEEACKFLNVHAGNHPYSVFYMDIPIRGRKYIEGLTD